MLARTNPAVELKVAPFILYACNWKMYVAPISRGAFVLCYVYNGLFRI